MVTTPEPEPREPNDAEKLAARALELSRLAIAGHRQAAVRRPILWIVLLMAVLFLASDGALHPERLIVGGIALLVGTVLALSDQLV